MTNINYIVYPGNKTKYLHIIYDTLCNKITNNVFIEPFGGSGTISLYLSQFNFKNIFLNELDPEIYKIHYSFKYGKWSDLYEIIDEIWNYGDPRNNKKDYYKARNELNKKYFKKDSIKSGFFNWAISTFAINSMVRFGPNGFNQGWGNRGIEKNLLSDKMNKEKFNELQKRYEKIILFNEDFEKNINRFDKGILFVDPPYIEMNSGTYSFTQNKHDIFLNIIKNWKDPVLYTNILSNEINWNYKILRNNIGTAKPGGRIKELKKEVLYYHNI